MDYVLFQNYPNPFNPNTKIEFELPKNENVKLIIYDLLGREVNTLVNDNLSAGKHEAVFDGLNLSSGIYFYKLETEKFSQTKANTKRTTKKRYLYWQWRFSCLCYAGRVIFRF